MSSRMVGLAGLLLGMVLSGCGPAMPPPDEPPVSVGSDAQATTRELAMILPDRSVGPAEMEIWVKVFWAEGRRAKAFVSVDRVAEAEDDKPTHQAEAIRQAARRGAALIVVPGPGIQEALDEAAKLGTPMLALDEPLTAGGKPLPLVAYTPVEETARNLVQIALDAAKTNGFPTNGPAVILHRELDDRRADARASALEAALKAAKVDVLPRVTYNGNVIEAKRVLLAAIAEVPRLAMAFTTDEVGFPVLLELRRQKVSSDRFAVAGFTSDRKELSLVSFGQVAGIVDLNLPGAMPIVIRVARDLAAGKPVPDRTNIPQPISRANGEDLTDQLPKPAPIPDRTPPPAPKGRTSPPKLDAPTEQPAAPAEKSPN